MTIDDEHKAQILRYHFVEHWRVGTIASQLGVHHSTVERVLGEAGVERERQRPRRPSKLDPYMAFITETLECFPTLTAARLFDMVKARGQPHQLVVVEDLGQSGRCLGAGHIEVPVGHAERNAVQEAHAVARAVAALPAQPPLLV